MTGRGTEVSPQSTVIYTHLSIVLLLLHFFSCSANPVIPVFITWWGYAVAIVILDGALAPFSPILVSPMCIAVLLIHRKVIS